MGDFASTFRALPAPDWERDRAVPGLKAEATEVLMGRAPSTDWWRWAALGPDTVGKSSTPNQHVVGLGIGCLIFGDDPRWKAVRRWYSWQRTYMGKTYRKAEALGGDYQQLYILGSVLIALAAQQQGRTDELAMAHEDLRRHAAINRLLRVPGSNPPRSLSFGCRTAIPDETLPQALACVLEGLPPERWGDHGGQPLANQLERPGRLTGVAVLRLALEAGLIALPYLATTPEVVREIVALDLRLPWPMQWRGWGDALEAWWAHFFGDFPDGGETTGGVLDHASAGKVPRIEPYWSLVVGPDGVTIDKAGGGAVGSITPPKPSKPAPPPRQEPDAPDKAHAELERLRSGIAAEIAWLRTTAATEWRGARNLAQAAAERLERL